jgi:hypothetical protein
MTSETYETLNKAWKSTCKVLLGDEIGELGDFKGYLNRNIEPISQRKSVVSGKEITISDEGFCKSASFIGNDEIAQFEKSVPGSKLDMNEIKDIDSIADALSERLAYSGSVLLGGCSSIESSHRCTDSHFIMDSHEMIGCKYGAYCSLLRDCEYAFGCNFTGEGKFGINCTQFFHSSRCFEAVLTMVSSDCHYTANMEACANCMFSFNLKGKSNCIGNLELPKDKFSGIKAGLLAQIRDELKAKKGVMGVAELLSWGKPAPKALAKGLQTAFRPGKPPQKEVEKAFSDTAEILFGKRLSGLAACQDWLFRHVRTPISQTSASSGKLIHVNPVRGYTAWAGAAVSRDEADGLGKSGISAENAEKMSLSGAKEALKAISYSTSELVRGMNSSVEECVNYFDSSDCFGGCAIVVDKRSAYSFYIRECEYMFGCEMAYYSKFCMKCYHSASLSRCFEVLDSKSSSDCYFCHNVENVHDSMFCFNAKNLRHAIGNVQLAPEAYRQAKKAIIGQIASEIESKKSLKWDIYNIGCAK